MKKKGFYATWPQTIFLEIVMLVAIAFMWAEYLATGSLEAIKGAVFTSVIGFISSLFLMGSALGKYPLLRKIE